MGAMMGNGVKIRQLVIRGLVVACAIGIVLPMAVGGVCMTGHVNSDQLMALAIDLPVVLVLVSLMAFLKPARYRFSALDGWVLVFAGYWFVRYVAAGSSVPTRALLMGMSVGTYFTVRIVVSSVRGGREIFYVMLCVLSLLEWGWGMGQLFGYCPSHHAAFRFTGSFLNPGPYSGFLAVILPISLWIGMSGDRKWVRSVGWISTAATAVILPAGMSRAAWVAALCGVVPILWGHRDFVRWRKAFMRRRRIVSVLVIVSVVGIVGMGIMGAYGLKRDSADGRLLVWRVASRTVCDRPLVGHGPGSFAGVYGDVQAKYFSEDAIDPRKAYLSDCPEYAFNEYLQMVVELGFIGLILYGIVLVAAVRSAYRQRWTGLMGAIVAVSVFAFFSYPFRLCPFMTILSVMFALVPPDSEKDVRPVFRIVPILLFGVCLCIGKRLIDKADDLRQWQEEKKYYSMSIYEGTVDGYRRLYPSMREYAHFLFEYGQCLAKTGQYEESLTVMKEGSGRSADPMFFNVIGRNEQALGHFEAAEQAFWRAWRMVPNRLYPLYLLATLYVETGQEEKAIRVIRKALDMPVKVKSPAIEEMKNKLKKLWTCIHNRKN